MLARGVDAALHGSGVVPLQVAAGAEVAPGVEDLARDPDRAGEKALRGRVNASLPPARGRQRRRSADE